MYFDDDGYDTADQEANSKLQRVPLTRHVLKRSVILILGSLAIGALLVWVILFTWFLQVVAVLMKLAVLGLGYFVGKKVYNFVGDSYPSWARLTVAIILGFAVSVAAMGLTLSHKFVRISNEMTPDNSGDG